MSRNHAANNLAVVGQMVLTLLKLSTAPWGTIKWGAMFPSAGPSAHAPSPA